MLIPIGVNLDWPYEVLAVLLFIVLGLLLFVGQTMIFLLRLVAADRREVGRRRPLASPTPTVGELEDSLGPAPLAGEVEDNVDLRILDLKVAGQLFTMSFTVAARCRRGFRLIISRPVLAEVRRPPPVVE